MAIVPRSPTNPTQNAGFQAPSASGSAQPQPPPQRPNPLLPQAPQAPTLASLRGPNKEPGVEPLSSVAARRKIADVRKANLHAASLQAEGLSADTAAEAIRFSEQYELPFDMVRRNFDQVAQRSMRDIVDEFAVDAPVAAEWAAENGRFALAKDDLRGLTSFERAVKDGVSAYAAMTTLPRSFASDLVGTALGRGVEGWGRLTGIVGGAYSPLAWVLGPALSSDQAGAVLQSAGQALIDSGELIGPDQRSVADDVAGALGQVVGYGLAGVPTGGLGAAVLGLGQGANIAGERAEAFNANRDQMQGVLDEAMAIAQSRLDTFVELGADEYDLESANDAVREIGNARAALARAEQETIDIATVAGAVVTGVTERLGFAWLFNRLPPRLKSAAKQRLADVLIAGGLEGLQETLEGVGQNVVALALYDPDADIFDEDLLYEAGIGGAAGAIVRMATGARMRSRTLSDSDLDARYVEGITRAAQNISMTQKAPAEIEALVTRIKEESPDAVESIYLDVEQVRTYFQEEGVDPVQALGELTGDPETVREAMDLGGDIEVSLEKWVARVAQSPHADALARLARTNPDLLSRADLETVDLDALVEEYSPQLDTSEPAAPPPGAAIVEEVKTSLTDVGFTPADAERWGRVYARRAEERARRRDLNESAEDIWRMFPVDFRLEMGSPESTAQEPGVQQMLEQAEGTVRRGRIEFRTSGGASIVLTRDMNPSTLIHETGHLWLDELITDATSENTSPKLARDLDTLLEQFGLGVRAADGAEAVQAAIGSEHHETFARSVEGYFFEGRSPTQELQAVFSRFRAWLVALGKNLARLNVELSPEVRAVIDRLIAADVEIAAARAQDVVDVMAQDMEAALELGITEREAETLAEAHERAVQEAEASLQSALLQSWNRENQEWWAEEREKVREEVEARIDDLRIFRALSVLQGDGPETFKLSRKELVDRYGEEVLRGLPGPGTDRNRGRYVYTRNDGMPLDEAAALLGFQDADVMVDALTEAPDRTAAVEAETSATMESRYPDLMNDPALRDEAQKAVRGNARMQLLERELRVLARRAGLPATPTRMLAEAARRIIAGKTVRGLRPKQYLTGERKAAARVAGAVAAARRNPAEAGRRLAEAHSAKLQQVLNAKLYQEATRAQERAEVNRRYIQRFGKDSVRKRIGLVDPGLLDQADVLMDQYDFRRLSGRDIDARAKARDILKAVEEGVVFMPQDLVDQIADARRVNWRELSFELLEGLADTFRQIDAQAKAYRELEAGERKIKLETAVMQVSSSIREGNPQVVNTLGARTAGDAVRSTAGTALGAWLTPGAIARQLDGGDPFGPVTQNIIVPMRRAITRVLEPRREAHRRRVAEIYNAHFTAEELAGLNRKMTIPELGGMRLSMGDLISIGLNWGSEGGRAAVIGSRIAGQPAFTIPGLQQAIGRLSSKHWDFITEVWTYIDGFWPEIKAQEQKLRGIVAEKVEAAPFEVTTSDGETRTIPGGYYPIHFKADVDGSKRIKSEALDDGFDKLTAGGSGAVMTRPGFTKARKDSGGRPVDLSIGVWARHVESVIQELALREPVGFVNQILESEGFKNAVITTGNQSARESLRLWLRDVAVGDLPAKGAAEVALAWTQAGFTKAKLGWSATVTLLQLTGFTQALPVVGYQNMTVALAKWAKNPVAAHNMVMGASPSMKLRYQLQSFNANVQDTTNLLENTFGPIPSRAKSVHDALSATYFYPIAKTQMIVDEITWMAAARQAEQQGLTGEAIADFADARVEQTQTSGLFVDRSGIARGTLHDRTRQSRYVRIWTTLMAYMQAKTTIAYESGKHFNRNRTPVEATRLATTYMTLILPEVLLGALIRGQWPDEDENYGLWLATETAKTLVAGIPIVREITAAEYNSGSTPVGSLAKDMFDVISSTMTDADQGELRLQTVKTMSDTAGVLVGLPSSQINRAIDAWWREDDGEDVAWYEYIMGRRN